MVKQNYHYYRIDFLKELPKNSICAEIGAARGNWSKKIVEITEPKELWLIDKWIYEGLYPPDYRIDFLKNFFELRKQTKIKVVKGYFEEIHDRLPKNYFDWVYLDLDHGYETTAKQLRICFDLIKENGLLTGDDYGQIENFPYHKGLVKAVNEFIDEYSDKIEVEYLNKKEPENSLQYKIRRICYASNF
jgi:hypothetical protein